MDAGLLIQLAHGKKVVVGVSSEAKSLNDFPDDNSGLAPPESISNSEVKRSSADGSVGFPHVRVGHRQDFFASNPFGFEGFARLSCDGVEDVE